jgi:hypothetical protein
LGSDLVAHHARNADPAGLGERLEPRRDVDAVAEQILALHNDVVEMTSPTCTPMRNRIC